MRAVRRRARTGVGAIVTASALTACARFSSGETVEVAPAAPAEADSSAIAPPPGTGRCASRPTRADAYVERRLTAKVLAPRVSGSTAASLVGAHAGRAYVVVTEGTDTFLRSWGDSPSDARELLHAAAGGSELRFRVDARGGVTAFDRASLDRVEPSGARAPIVAFPVRGEANRATTGTSFAFVTALPTRAGDPTEIRAYPLAPAPDAGAEPSEAFSDPAPPRRIVAVEDRPVWLSETAPGSYVVKTVVEGEVTQVSSSLTLESLAADAHYAFALTTDGQSSSLLRASLASDGSDELVLIGSRTSQDSIAVDGEYVYFTASWGTVGLFRVPRCGGTVERLDVLGSATGPIFVDARQLFVENADEIRRYELP